MKLQRVASADCPHCGCNATKLIGAGNAGRVWARFECDHCGKQFRLTPTGADAEDRVSQYVYQTIPICPIHQVPMHNNGRADQGMVVYYKCPECPMTGKGERKIK